MKKIMAMLLIATSIHRSTAAQGTNNTSNTATNCQAALAILIVGVVAVGTVYTVYVHEKDAKNIVVPVLVLQISDDMRHWVNVCWKTNVTLIGGTNASGPIKTKVFQSEIDNLPNRDTTFVRVMTP